MREPIDKKSQRLIQRHCQLCFSKIAAQHFKKINSRYPGRFQLPLNTVKLATRFPATQQSEKLIQSSRDRTSCRYGIRSSEKEWCLLLNGKRNLLNSHVETQVKNELARDPDTDYLDSPVWSLLGDPLMQQESLDDLKPVLLERFDTKPFSLESDSNNLKYKRIFSTYLGIRSVNNLDMLALRMLLYREYKLGKGNRQGWHLKPRNALLLLLRLLTTSHLEHASDGIFRSFYLFYHLNNHPNLTYDEIENILHNESADRLLEDFFRKILPDGCSPTAAMCSLNDYLQCSDDLASDAIKYFIGENYCGNTCTDEVLFWVDHYSDEWLTGKTDRVDAIRNNPELKKRIRHQLLYGEPLVKIW